MADALVQTVIGDAGTHILRGYYPSWKSLSAGDLNGPKASDPEADRPTAWFLVTDIPGAIAQALLAKLERGTYLITVPAGIVLDNLGDGQYRLSEEVACVPELRHRFAISESDLIAKFPAATVLIQTLFDKTEMHPLPGGVVPSVSWATGVRDCFFDRWAEVVVDGDDLEA